MFFLTRWIGYLPALISIISLAAQPEKYFSHTYTQRGKKTNTANI